MENQKVDTQIQEMLTSTKTIKKKGGKKRFIIPGIVFGIAIIGFGIFQILSNSKVKPQIVETVLLTKGDITDTLVVNGPIEGTDSVDVTSGIHAKVTELLVKEGDSVEKDSTVLLKIDPEGIQKNIDAVQGVYDLKVAQKSERVKGDNNNYAKAVQDLHNAQNNYNRQAQLVASGAAPQTDLEQAQIVLEDAKRVLSTFNVKGGKVVADTSYDIDIENSQRELDSLKDQLKNTVLLAPISGTVTRVNTKVGQFADAIDGGKNSLLTIEKLDELQMQLMISEYNIGKVSIGQKVTISADILGEGNTVQGEVMSISPSGEPKGGNSTERVIPIKVRILEQGSKLISGITAKASILLEESKNTYLVPLSSVGDDGTGKTVMQFIVKSEDGSETISIKEVETGIEDDMNIELKKNPLGEGIPESEISFVKTYNPDLVEGQLVTSQPQE